MIFKNKLEEDKSYAPLFLALSAVLMAVLIWVIVDEAVIIRPWKGYQKRFYKLEQEYLFNNALEERAAFEKSDEYKGYLDIKAKLTEAEERYNSEDVQKREKELTKELNRLKKKELKPVTSKLISGRNKKLEIEYNFGHYPEDAEYYLAKIKEVEIGIGKYEKQQASLVKKKDTIVQNISMLSVDVQRYTAELGQYTEILDAIDARYVAAKRKRPTLQVYQTFLPELDEADRCMSCHAGINKDSGISDENPYKAHPDKDYYIGNHPVEEFGCVVCHEGQGRALTSVEEAHGEVEYWLTPLLRGKNAESSCVKCHGIDEDLEGAKLLAKGKKIFTKKGCYRCHETKGFQYLEKSTHTGPSLTNVAYSTKPNWLISWIQHPKQLRPDTSMPNFDFSREEAEAIASYLWKVSEETIESYDLPQFPAGDIEEGKRLFSTKGCYVCHSDGNEGLDFAPNLFNIGDKLNYKYAVNWLLNPKKYQPQSVMPSFRLSEDEAKLMAAYLMTLTAGKTQEKQHTFDLSLADKGEGLIKRYGCFSCHKIKGMEKIGRIGVELTKIGSKSINFLDFGVLEHEMLHEVDLKYGHENVGLTRRTWIKAKLKEPRVFDEGRYKLPKDKLRMPNFELTDDEIEALSVFLTGLVDTTIPEAFKYKPTKKKKDFNDGLKVVEKFNCMGCHQFSLDTITLANGYEIEGVIKKEKKGKVYFQLWKESKEFKKGAGKTVRFEKEEIVSHEKGKGARVAGILTANLIKHHNISEKEVINYLPPKLYGQGQKTQPAWLYGFLKSPVILRPWYKAVMPTFNMTDEEAENIAKYFAIRDEAEYPFEYIKEKNRAYINSQEKKHGGYMAKASELFNSPTVNCISCHIRGDIMPEGKPSDWAPDLSISKDRLKPEWISKWLSDPQAIQPGTKMPTFFSEGMYQDIMPGKPEFQIQAVKTYLMNFNN